MKERLELPHQSHQSHQYRKIAPPGNDFLSCLDFCGWSFFGSCFLNHSRRERQFEKLPVLEKIVDREKVMVNLSKTLLVCGQHLLETTGSLFEAYIALGAKPENIYVIGKIYSNNESVENRLQNLGIHVHPNSEQTIYGNLTKRYAEDVAAMWARVLKEKKCCLGTKIKRVLVIDDGGYVLERIPKTILGKHSEEAIELFAVEQTSSGLDSTHVCNCSVIEVATAAAKAWLEPSWIAKMIVEKVDKCIQQLLTKGMEIKSYAVVGLGRVGSQVLLHLLQGKSEGQKIVIYDKNIEKTKTEFGEAVVAAGQLKEVFNSDIIIGCTGTDIALPGCLEVIKNKKDSDRQTVCISVSSTDIEFRGILTAYHTEHRKSVCDPLADIHWYNCIVKRGGTPVNFDGGCHSVESSKIQVTRGLLLEAVLQACTMFPTLNRTESKNYMLDPIRQQKVMESWYNLEETQVDSYVPSEKFSQWLKKEDKEKLDFIKSDSGGEKIESNSYVSSKCVVF
jgi:hypothetical protein